MSTTNPTHTDGGVNYAGLDPWKVAAQEEGRATADNINRLGFTEIAESRGQSAYLVEHDDFILAHVVEGLGTKNLVADAVREITGQQYYSYVAECAAATILNDLATSGADPLTLLMHLSVASEKWLEDKQRTAHLAVGWRRAADIAGCSWGGGETPALSGIIVPGASELSGSAVGIIAPKHQRIRGNVKAGQAIVLLESSGIHANGLTLARMIGDKEGYDSRLAGGRMYGEALLDPTLLYSPVVRAVLKSQASIAYAVNITGHGWRKLMRAEGEKFIYRITEVPEPPPVFDFIQQHGPDGHISDYDMYGAYNMGAGFALMVDQADTPTVIKAARGCGIHAWVGGMVEEADTGRAVVIEPLDLWYEESTLSLS